MGKKRWLWIAPSAAIAALVAAPRIAQAFRQWEYAQRQAALQQARAAVAAGADGLPDITALLDPSASASDPDSLDNASIRALAMAAEIGPRTPETQQMLLQIAAQQTAIWADPTAVPAGVSSRGTRTWRSIGPQAARTQFNGIYYKAMDSGRPTDIALHPTDPNTVFVATSGGGLWYAPNLNSSYPTWTPLTDNLGSLAIGAFAIDKNVAANGSLTIWLGLGDAFDQQSGVVVKGTWTPNPATGIATATWGAPIALSTASHPADGRPSAALNVRDLAIDPLNSSHILVATNDGFYQSFDGATFTLTDLPDAAAVGATRESTWQIVYLGSATPGVSQWLVSGVYACPFLTGMSVPPSPPTPQLGAVTCPGDANAAHYNKGDFWKSTDSGATWTSIRQSGGLPATVTASTANDVGRIEMAGVAAANPATTVLYAQAATAQEISIPSIPPCVPVTGTGGTTCTIVAATAWHLKSVDGGSTWSTIATGLRYPSAAPPITPTAVTNPSTLSPDSTTTLGGQGCTTMNLGHLQSWYNLAVAVDPGDPNRAIFGGDLCSAITKDGGATFSIASNWLPQSGLGFTQFGFLPYVHADWHTALAARIAGQAVILAGTDGGFFVARDLWDVTSPELSSWQQPNVGLTTHLFYGIGSGDPTLGNPNLVFGGTQDNGTRWRLVQDDNFIQEFNSGNWDQILGGDGLGAGTTSDTIGQNAVYWISVNGSRRFCRPRSHDCSQATRIENGVETANWISPGVVGGGDPFLIRYTPVGDDTSGMLSASNLFPLLWFVNQFDQASISIRSLGSTASLNIDLIVATRNTRGMGLRASPYRYTLDTLTNTRLYGGVLTSGSTAMGSYIIIDHGPAPAPAPVMVVSTNSVHFGPSSFFLGTGVGTGTIWIGNGSDIAMPQNPASLGGTDSKQTWLVASNAVLSNPVNCANPAAASCDPAVIIPASIGHLYKTTDRGATWTPFHGNGTGFDLPNIPVYVIKYDPTDTTDQTIWLGTELGVYRTTDGGNTWAPYGLGLPLVRVTDIQISNNGSLVRVSTYGRGVWEIYPNSEPAVASGSGDFNRTKVIDFFSLASLAARMGADPDATTNLVYDSSLDLNTAIPTGKTKTTIDETDLSALVAKFGSNLP